MLSAKNIIGMLLFIIGVTGVHANYSSGLESYKQGNYSKAFRSWFVASRQGDANANLGLAKLIFENRVSNSRDHYSYAIGVLNKMKGIAGTAADVSYLWGVAYREGYGVSKNQARAAEYFKKSSELGSIEAIKALLFTLSSAVIGEIDAESFLDKCANSGDDECQYHLSKRLEEKGRSVDSRKWLKASADSGFPDAQLDFATILRSEGKNNQAKSYLGHLEKNPRASMLQKSAAGIIESDVAWTYKDGLEKFSQGDCARAIAIWAGIEKNSPESAYKLGEIYEKGSCGRSSSHEALQHYRIALEQDMFDGAMSACRLLTTHLYDATNPEAYEVCATARSLANSEKEQSLADEGLRKAMPFPQLLKNLVKNNDCERANSIVGTVDIDANDETLIAAGRYHIFGVCSPTDGDKAWRYFQSVYERGNSSAAIGLGIIEFYRLTNASSHRGAKFYMNIAKENGSAEANYYLGMLAELSGEDNVAVKFYKAGIDAGDSGSMLRLALMKAGGTGGEWRSTSGAVRLIQDAVEIGHRDAYYYLALAHEKGWGGLESSGRLQKKYCKKSADNGSVKGALCLCERFGDKSACRFVLTSPLSSSKEKDTAR